MKKMAIIFLMVLTTICAMPADTTNFTATINAKRVEFNSDLRAQMIQKSVDLLASCACMDAKPKWGAPAEQVSIAEAQKHSHLHLVFSRPVKVEVPTEKVTLQVREMVISFPLVTAGIWVRTDEGVLYFAMFDHTACEALQQQLDKAVKP
jgi:hypothetical protein